MARGVLKDAADITRKLGAVGGALAGRPSPYPGCARTAV